MFWAAAVPAAFGTGCGGRQEAGIHPLPELLFAPQGRAPLGARRTRAPGTHLGTIIINLGVQIFQVML